MRTHVRMPAAPALLALVLLLGGTAAGCGDAADHAAPAMTEEAAAPVVAPTVQSPIAAVPAGEVTMPSPDEVTATWKARPDYVRVLPGKWQEAYAFALARPDVLQWIPCYCGCDGLGHRSNLDCFFQSPGVFEEHGSYCDICVETANLASSMLREGATVTEIRAAVDARFGNDQGTDTPLPPA